MPGAYTHISVAMILTSGIQLKKLDLAEGARAALLDYSEFCHMGSIGPDYPYMVLLGSGKEPAGVWADAMHHKFFTETKQNIFHVGIDRLRALEGEEQKKCLSWFLGYTSHITADVTCHPMTNLLVGDYEAENETDHRISELNQDVYIFSTRLKGDVSKSEHIKNVIGACRNAEEEKGIDRGLEKFWLGLLETCFPNLFARHPAEINDWHSAVQFVLDDIGEELSLLPSRHIRRFFEDKGVAYPRPNEIDMKYIREVDTPAGRMSYDDLFDHVLANVGKVWKLISEGVFLEDDKVKEELGMWHLDNGQEIQTPKVMWRKNV